MNRFPLIAVAAVLSAAPTMLPAQGSSATYHYVFTGHFWNGSLVEADRTDTLKRSSADVDLSKHDAISATTTESRGTVNADGTVSIADTAAASDPFSPYNAVALLVHGAPSYESGATWTTQLAVQTGPHVSDTTRVPVSASVASVDGDAVTVRGTGKLSALSSYGEYRDPVDLTIQIAARFAGGALQRADYKATEYVHAGPLSQQMNWTWSLLAQ